MGLFRPGPRVGVLEVYGPLLGSHRIATYDRMFTGVRENRHLRALVVDIDSPGGSAPGADLLYHSLRRVAEKKPVVAFIRSVGASGAYYLACAATRIVASPAALVGSIGVISVQPVAQGLIDRLGLGVYVYKGGAHKDLGAFWRTPSVEEQARLQGLVDQFYAAFVQVVAQARRLDEAQARERATGEVFLAPRAKELGLVDELGGFQQAVELAARLARVPPRAAWLRPRRPLLERLLGRLGPSLLEGVERRLAEALLPGVYYLPPR